MSLMQYLPESKTSVNPHPSEEVLLDSVKITPSCLRFENAYEGKHFEAKLVIQNCGENSALIRLEKPNSSLFDLKYFNRGHYLCPGLKIVRTVTYTYTSAIPVLNAFTYIHVNAHMVKIPFLVTLSEAFLSIEPELLDFGRIDAVNSVTTRRLLIKNSGYKATQFAIDLGRNFLDLNIEPMKGTIHAKTSVSLNVEIAGFLEGSFLDEFWIKTNQPIRVLVSGKFISPKLLVRKFISSLDFTLLEFHPTYCGSNYTLPLLIKNFSSSSSMFCVMAEVNGRTMTLENARKIDENYRNFKISPCDGRLQALKGSLIQITFNPVKTKNKRKNYATGFIKIIRMDCRDVPADLQDNKLQSNHKHSANNKPPPTNEVSNFQNGDYYSSAENQADTVSASLTFEHSIGVCLYGEKILPQLAFTPDIILLSNLCLSKVYHRTILVTNMSTVLPITLCYKKVASIDVYPAEFEVFEKKSFEVLVTIKSSRLGSVVKNVAFAVLGRNYPDDNKLNYLETCEVRVQFDTNSIEKITKYNFNPCEDLTLKLEPELPFRLTSLKLADKVKNDRYYLEFMKNLKHSQAKNFILEDYDTTSSTKPLKIKKKDQQYFPIPEKKISNFVPLAPHLLYNIKIFPKSIRLQKVAAFTTITSNLVVTNENVFPIWIKLYSSKSCIDFKIRSKQIIIKSKEEKTIDFFFSSSIIGKYYITIKIVVNSSTLFEVTVVAHVVPKQLELEATKIDFSANDGCYKFFKINNNLNATTSFDWEVPKGSFEIYPNRGKIRAENFLLSVVTYKQAGFADCLLSSENNHKCQLQITASKKKSTLFDFDSSVVDFGLMALNVGVSRTIILKNLTKSKICYTVVNDVVIPGVTIQPKTGTIHELATQEFAISAKINCPIKFELFVTFNINSDNNYQIVLKGTVEYPSIVYKPLMLFFQKVPLYSFDVQSFEVRNNSNCEAYIKFPLGDFHDFTIYGKEKSVPLHEVVLQPKETKHLFLHFHPTYVSTCSFMLPFVINDVLGPVYISSTLSTNPLYFFQEHLTVFKDVQNVEVSKLPNYLSSIRVNSSAFEKLLKFSSLDLNFAYYGKNHYNNVEQLDLKITNISQKNLEVCVRVDTLEDLIGFGVKSDKEYEYLSKISYRFELGPEKEIVFLAKLCEDLPSSTICTVRLPVFVKSYSRVFNYITLKVAILTPTITPSRTIVQLEPVPSKTPREVSLTLCLECHFGNCNVFSKSDVDGLCLFFPEGQMPEKGKFHLPITISCVSFNPNSFSKSLWISCTCGVSCKVIVSSVVDNCILTTHAYFQMLKQFCGKSGNFEKIYKNLSNISSVEDKRRCESYILFPKDSDGTQYGVYMRKLQKTLENWIYTQGFHLRKYYVIPNGFVHFFRVPKAKKGVYSSNKKGSLKVPLLELISNMAGSKIESQVLPSSVPGSTDKEWLSFLCQLYCNILQWLRQYPVFIPNITAKYLLNYHEYTLYEKYKNHQNLMTKETFHRYSKQCWIDLILQLIKVFVLFKTGVMKETDLEKNTKTISQISKTSEDEFDNVFNIEIYGDHERMLKQWLENSFDLERENLWSKPLAKRAIVFFDSDLKDGLMLGAVTAHYCPYVRDLIQTMYPDPGTSEECFHNICTLIKTWKRLNFSYEVSPFAFESSTLIEMVLLVLYLYSVVPNCSPVDSITIQAPLTQTNSTFIDLTNLGNETACYTPIFFGNENNFFKIASKHFILQPKSTKAIEIKYLAKFVRKANSTLLFSGETPNYKYSKSLAIDLVGVADVSFPYKEFSFNVKLYKLCEIPITIEAPFKTKTEYEILIGYQIEEREKTDLYSLDEIKSIKTVKEFLLQDEICEFNELGICSTKLVLCCMQKKLQNIWLYFCNANVGDFAVKIAINGISTDENFEKIDVVVPEKSKRCKCQNGKKVGTHCSALIEIDLPSTNNLLWNARKTMLLQCATGAELKFWTHRIFTQIGTRILKLMLNSETHLMRLRISESIEFKIHLPKNCPFVAPKVVRIDDIISSNVTKIYVHPVEDLLSVANVDIHLNSLDGSEQRFYRLCFKSESEGSSGRRSAKI